jgi:hypothetical protein
MSIRRRRWGTRRSGNSGRHAFFKSREDPARLILPLLEMAKFSVVFEACFGMNSLTFLPANTSSVSDISTDLASVTLYLSSPVRTLLSDHLL